MRKLGASRNFDSMTSEQKIGKSDREEHDPLDNFIRQAIGKESFQPFSTACKYRSQWIPSFQALEQWGTDKLFKGPKVDRAARKDWQLEYCNGVTSLEPEMNGITKSVNFLRSSRNSVKGTKNSSDAMHSLKIPEAVVAFAQAAAKTNGEPEKYLHGWPLLSPAQIQKCDKCSREFCSPINYRRHIRVHRKSSNIDKDSVKNRGLLAAFWDKLTMDEAKEVISFKDVALEDVTGSSIIKALASFIRKLGFSSLPHAYVKAGAALLDIVQAKSSRFPISSEEFFGILDDASERTFLCAGTAVSLQKFVFDGEAGKIGLEMKNLVACTSFLVEQKLVKSWIADKDAEALRCQKLLVEEEEAAQRRQAELLERKRLKKLRQKEQRVKLQINEDQADPCQVSCAAIFSDETSNLLLESAPAPRNETSNSAISLPEPASMDIITEMGDACLLTDGHTDTDAAVRNGHASVSQNIDSEAEMQQKESQRKLAVGRRSPKNFRNIPNGLHSVQIPSLRSVAVQKRNSYRDQKAVALSNSHQVWTRKVKLVDEEEKLHLVGLMESGDQTDHSSSTEVLIGSIPIVLGDNGSPRQDNLLATVDDQNPRKNIAQAKHVKADLTSNVVERSTVKLWRPVGRHEISGPILYSDERKDGVDGLPKNGVDLSGDILSVCNELSSSCNDSLMVSASKASSNLRNFSTCVATAKDFLRQRWKGALAAGVVLTSQTVLSLDCNGTPDAKAAIDDDEDDDDAAPVISDGYNGRVKGMMMLHQSSGVGQVRLVSAAGGSITPKFRARVEKGSRLKYVPKQRMVP